MKTKQVKDDTNKTEDDSLSEPKTRARKKASDANEEAKSSVEEAKTSAVKRAPGRAKVIAKKGPLGVRKTLRNKKVVVATKQKNVLKSGAKRGRKPAVKTEPVEPAAEEETLIPPSEIKSEPVEEIAQSSQSSRSSSPKTAGRRQRLSSDMIMMKSVLSDSPSTLVVGSRTSPYSTRSDRSNSPSITDSVSPRRGKPRKIQNNLRNEVVIKEQNKRRRLPSESKSPESPESTNKRVKRGRSCSRDGSEISKCSDITESDISLSEPPTTDIDNKELKKLDKPKTDLELDNVNVQISTTEQVPFDTNISLPEENKTDEDPSVSLDNKTQKPMSLKRSTSLDADNNNSNRVKLETKLETFNSLDIDDKASLLIKTGNDALSTERSSILTSMFKTFNSKEVAKNIRKVRRGRGRATTSTRPSPSTAKTPIITNAPNSQSEEKETLESLSKEIDDLISNLDQKMDEENQTLENVTETSVTSPINKPFGVPKPLTDSNSIASNPEIVKDKAEDTLQSLDDSENIKLHFEDDSEQSPQKSTPEIPFKCTPVASIDKLMDRLKEFEEFDKRRQRQESETKSDSSPVMVTNDVVLIPKSGDIKTLKDHKNMSETMKSPERPVEKENVLSCFENNSAISIVKRDHIRKSVDVDLPNSVSLIKRNSISRKESTGSNNSRESNDAISIFEKSLGKDVTLTEIRKSVDKPAPPVNILQLATLHPNKPGVPPVPIDHKEVSITPRVLAETKTNSTITKRKSRDSLSRKSSESGTETDDKMATLEKIVSPVAVKAIAVIPLPIAVKSPEIQPMETEPQAPPMDIVKAVPEDLPTAEIIKEAAIIEELKKTTENEKPELNTETKQDAEDIKDTEIKQTEIKDEKESKISESADVPKSKSPNKASKSARNSTENEAGPSNVLLESPETQKRKESVLRTLGLLTHKAFKEAKIEKEKEKERLYGVANSKKTSKSGEYTGTLKTVIKLNRNSGDKKKHRSSLKMTFQKSKVRSGKQSLDAGEALQDEYYTIERKEIPGVASDDGELEPTPEVKEPTLNLVIPEKASSFSIHPGRLCMDQCFYCGGKFGLFDTPCHIAQMKSADRQKKVLDNEEKLTIDSCLCDACYRHVDRRANCPSYRKRPALKQTSHTFQQNNQQNNTPANTAT